MTHAFISNNQKALRVDWCEEWLARKMRFEISDHEVRHGGPGFKGTTSVVRLEHHVGQGFQFLG